tara:strand:+ start:379 stop:513 length:135 start_codon:yes stop_codon:yes gene_type:complete
MFFPFAMPAHLTPSGRSSNLMVDERAVRMFPVKVRPARLDLTGM